MNGCVRTGIRWMSFGSHEIIMNDALKAFNMVKACLTRFLASNGFSVKNYVAWRPINDTVLLIEIQKDKKHNSEDVIRFTVNIGISIDALRKFEAIPEVLPPTLAKCHWRQRLGRLMPQEADLWWSVADNEDATLVCEQILKGLSDFALPKIKSIASSEVLMKFWEEDIGQGLTEYERRVYLARLLVFEKRGEQARAALESLEKASIGRLWEKSAAVEIEKLRDRLR